MRFQYTEKKVTLPENVHKYAEKKVMKLERFFGTDADALVTFSVEPEEGTFELVRMKKFNMKPMTREEAILQMNLLEHTFFAFRDEDNDGAFAVVYKRTDGGYGLIEDQA